MRTLTAEEILAETDGDRLLIRFCRAIESGNQPDPATLNDLAARFRRILAGERPQSALALVRGRGRPQLTGAEADRQMAVVAEVLLRRENGETLENALAAVADDHGMKEHTLQGWHKKHRQDAERWLRYFRHLEEKYLGSR